MAEVENQFVLKTPTTREYKLSKDPNHLDVEGLAEVDFE